MCSLGEVVFDYVYSFSNKVICGKGFFPIVLCFSEKVASLLGSSFNYYLGGGGLIHASWVVVVRSVLMWSIVLHASCHC